MSERYQINMDRKADFEKSLKAKNQDTRYIENKNYIEELNKKNEQKKNEQNNIKSECSNMRCNDPLLNEIHYKTLNKKFEWKIDQEIEKNFRNRYQDFSNKLENMLDLPKWIIMSFAKKESTFWLRLDSGSWSKWIMQLTNRPFKTMKESQNIDYFKKVFGWLDINSLKNIEIWNGLTIKNTLTDDIWDKLEKLSSPNLSNEEYVKIINDFQYSIKKLPKQKWHENDYFHTLNIIIWWTYYKMHLDNSGNNIEKAANKYNWDKTWKYGKLISRNFKNEQLFLSKNSII